MEKAGRSDDSHKLFNSKGAPPREPFVYSVRANTIATSLTVK